MLKPAPACLLAALLAFAAGPPPVFAQAEEENGPAQIEEAEPDTAAEVRDAALPEPSKNPTLAAVRSALVPGWGQAYTHSWLKAILFFGGDAGLLYGVWVQNDRYRESLDLSRRTRTEAEKEFYENRAEFYRDDRNRLIWWTAGLMVIASLDAYVEAHLYDFHIDPTLTPAEGSPGAQLGLTITGDLHGIFQ